VKNHTFFAPINWSDLEKRRITPPFKPQVREHKFYLKITGRYNTIFFLREPIVTKEELDPDSIVTFLYPDRYRNVDPGSKGNTIKKKFTF
jgi:hypothetical protein